MKKQTGACIFLWAIVLVGQIALAAEQKDPKIASQTPTTPVSIVDGISIQYPPRWVLAEVQLANARELVVPSTSRLVPLQARTLISYEQRRSHEEAVERLAAIGANVKSATVTFLQIGGWPAMQRRYRAPLPHRGEEEQSVAGEGPLALWTTTAVAAGNTLVRIDTTVFPGADPALADEADAAARQLISPAPTNPSASAQEVLNLKNKTVKLPHRIKVLPPSQPAPSPSPSPLPIRPEASTRNVSRNAATVVTSLGEIEVGVSNSGQNVVVASNRGVAVSQDFGATFPAFTPRGSFTPFPNQGDPSATVGASGFFYVSYLGVPNGKPPVPTLNGCSVTLMTSPTGSSWTMAGNAAFCPLNSGNVCSPDQEHIAADRINATGSGDQLYVVWRKFSGAGAICNQQGNGTPTSTITCSANNGSSFGPFIFAGSGDHPRVTVGSDGAVYVVQMDGDDVVVSKFTSCASGLTQVFPPVTVLSTDLPGCPVPGLDRCDEPQLSSPMLAVDDTNPKHVYLTYVENTTSDNDDIVVADSNDGGQTWNTAIAVSPANTPGHRFFPWVCSMGGTAFVTWYDRAAATAANNDLTNYFQGSAFIRGGFLTAGSPRNLSINSDPQCASPWPAGFDSSSDWKSCSIQPSAGLCVTSVGPPATGSRKPCNLNAPSCAIAGESCQVIGPGAPKYGDYNGLGCGGSRVVSAWASATAPPGLPSTGGQLQIFDDVLSLPTQLTVTLHVEPPGDVGHFNVLVNGITRISNSSIATWTSTVSPGSYTVVVSAQPPTVMGQYKVNFEGDCNLNGNLTVFTASSKTCTAMVENTAFSSCIAFCKNQRDGCIADAHGSAEHAACVAEFNGCQSECKFGKLMVTKTLAPAADPGKFNLLVDGTMRAGNVGNGGHTAILKLAPGTYTVSETAAAGTSLNNYTSVISGDCAADGKVFVTFGDDKTCTITNTAAPKLTVTKELSPAGDPGHFNLRIDGITKASNVGDGGSTGPQTVATGLHKVSEVAAAGTNLADYSATIGGDCSAGGSITLAPGDNKTCTILNQRKGPVCFNMCSAQNTSCLAGCKSTRDSCMKDVGTPGGTTASACAQAFNQCNKGCANELTQCNAKCK